MEDRSVETDNTTHQKIETKKPEVSPQGAGASSTEQLELTKQEKIQNQTVQPQIKHTQSKSKRNVGSVLKVLRGIPAASGWPALLEILEKRKDDDLIVQGIRWELADIIAFSNQNTKKARVKKELPPVVKTQNVTTSYANAIFNEETQRWQSIERKNGTETYYGSYDTDLEAHLASKSTTITTKKKSKKRKSTSFLELADLCERMPKNSELTKPPKKRKKQWRRSKFKGVTWDGRTQRWLCRVKWGNGLKYVGYFPTEMEAAKAHDVQARNLYADDLSAIKLNFGENGIHNDAIQAVANPEDSDDESYETKTRKRRKKKKNRKKKPKKRSNKKRTTKKKRGARKKRKKDKKNL